MFMLVKLYILIRSCRCKEATLQTIDASSNCWPSVEGELCQDLTSGPSLRVSSRGQASKQSGEVKVSRTIGKRVLAHAATLKNQNKLK